MRSDLLLALDQRLDVREITPLVEREMMLKLAKKIAPKSDSSVDEILALSQAICPSFLFPTGGLLFECFLLRRAKRPDMQTFINFLDQKKAFSEYTRTSFFKSYKFPFWFSVISTIPYGPRNLIAFVEIWFPKRTLTFSIGRFCLNFMGCPGSGDFSLDCVVVAQRKVHMIGNESKLLMDTSSGCEIFLLNPAL